MLIMYIVAIALSVVALLWAISYYNREKKNSEPFDAFDPYDPFEGHEGYEDSDFEDYH